MHLHVQPDGVHILRSYEKRKQNKYNSTVLAIYNAYTIVHLRPFDSLYEREKATRREKRETRTDMQD